MNLSPETFLVQRKVSVDVDNREKSSDDLFPEVDGHGTSSRSVQLHDAPTCFSHYYYIVYDHTSCFLPTHCCRRCCGPVDVASMSGALVSGAHENMPERVVDDRSVVFLSFTSSQVVYVNATACLKTTSKIPHIPDTEDTRPEDCSVNRRSGTGYRAAHFTQATVGGSPFGPLISVARGHSRE